MPDDSFLQSMHDGATKLAIGIQPLETDGARQTETLLETVTAAAEYTAQHGLPLTPSQLPAYADLLFHSNAIDDRKYLLEDLLTAMARLPPGSTAGARLQQKVIGLLYNNLPHPPHCVGQVDSVVPPSDGFEFIHRSADGSRYPSEYSTLGMARTAYARSVSPLSEENQHDLPHPSVVFDRLLKRDQYVEHPGGISSLFFAFANLVIHSIFSTDPSPGYIRNNVSSYLDLSPLYGSSKTEQYSVRRRDGTGKLVDDCFPDSRLLFMPPSTSALLIMFNRNHNYIAEQILAINEDGRYTNPPPTDKAQREFQEEKIFQTARLVNCGFFVQVILGDYVAAILGLVNGQISWRLDPRVEINNPDGSIMELGGGNICSIEFNLLYRWHAALSEQDTDWVAEEVKTLLQGRDPSTIPLSEYKKLLRNLRPKGPPKDWTFGGLSRDAHGRFADADLAKILMDATEARASAFKARGTPEVLRFVEELSIEQAREWGTCSLNEFRKFMKLKPYDNFKDWNRDPAIHEAAEELYGTIDNLELHVGLQAEEAKHPAPGAGFCPGYTISRAILADAVALVRGDPYLTTYNTPHHLTKWAYYQYLKTDKEDGSYGGVLTRMLFTLLPEHYPRGSAYAHFPFLTPDAIRGLAAEWPGNEAVKYTWTRPEPPVGPVFVAKTFKGVHHALSDQFDNGVERRLETLTRRVGLNREQVKAALYRHDIIADAVTSLSETLRQLLYAASHLGVGTSLTMDVVKNVLNVLPVHWICNDIAGVSLKTAQNEYGYHRAQEQYEAYTAASSYVYFNTSPVDDWTLRERSLKLADEIISRIKQQLDDDLSQGVTLNPMRFVRMFVNRLTTANDHNDHVIHTLARQLTQDGETARRRVAASVFAEYVPTAPLFSKALAYVVDFYLADERKAEREHIVALGAGPALLKYIYEALRLSPPMSVARVTAKESTTLEGVQITAEQPVLAGLANATRDPAEFPDPEKFNVSRSFSHLHIFGTGQRGLLSREYFDKVAPVVVHEILKLKNVRRATGEAGTISRFSKSVYGVLDTQCLNDKCVPTPFPASLHIAFDA